MISLVAADASDGAEPRQARGWLDAAERLVRRRLARSNIGVDEPGCAFAVRVHDRRFYRRVLLAGSLGLGESYVDGW